MGAKNLEDELFEKIKKDLFTEKSNEQNPLVEIIEEVIKEENDRRS